jgi:hypothetical protein
MTCDKPGTLYREHHEGGIEGRASATCEGAGPQVDQAGDLAHSDQHVHASQGQRTSPEARGRTADAAKPHSSEAQDGVNRPR